MKTKNTKGFTLAELLIVMAIIVVLAAVAIPTFGRQLETARETGDMEVIRSAYTEAMAYAVLDASDGLLDGKNGGTTLPSTPVAFAAVTENDATKGNYTVTLSAMDASAKITQTGQGWKYVNNTILGAKVPQVVGTKGTTAGTTTVTFTFEMANTTGSTGNVGLVADSGDTHGIAVDAPKSGSACVYDT